MAVGDYEVDRSIVRAKGGAPEGAHKNRCQGKNRNKEQCGQWALRGKDYCKWHGGRAQLVKRRRPMSIYSRRATGKLKDVLEELAANPDERMSLSGEIDVARSMALKAFDLLNAATNGKSKKKKEEGAEGNGVTEKSKTAAMRLMQQSLKDLSSLIDKQAKVTALLDRTLDVEQIGFIREQIIQILENRIEQEHPELHALVVQDLEKNLKLAPKSQVNINIG